LPTQVGYREIPETTASLKKIFRNVVEADSEDSKNKVSWVTSSVVDSQSKREALIFAFA
jgi:hypothetical protein